MLESLSPTKQNGARSSDSVYRYYAGYPPAFVESLLGHLGVSTRDVVLDPWNGAGTTTSVCSSMGISSVGIDANPFMGIVAAVRSSSKADVLHSVVRLGNYLREPRFSSEVMAPESAAASIIRGAEDSDVVTRDNMVACFILASAVRALYRSIRSSNPTWFSLRKLQALKSSPDDLRKFAVAETERLTQWTEVLSIPDKLVRPTLLTGDAATAWVGRRVDHIITSPPYLTRIDYVQKTLPELLFLRELYGVDLDQLRQMMLGTVLTGRNSASDGELPEARTARFVISAIENHSSKASGTYYLKFYLSYFDRLARTLKRLVKLLSDEGTVTIVTQGSYYKEIFVDLPRIVCEYMGLLGFHEVERSVFRSKNHMAAINVGTFASKQAAPEEVVSTFKRGT